MLKLHALYIYFTALHYTEKILLQYILISLICNNEDDSTIKYSSINAFSMDDCKFGCLCNINVIKPM